MLGECPAFVQCTAERDMGEVEESDGEEEWDGELEETPWSTVVLEVNKQRNGTNVSTLMIARECV